MGQVKLTGVMLANYVYLGKTVEITGWDLHVSVPIQLLSVLRFMC